MKSDGSLNILHLTTHLNIGGISSYVGMLGKALTKRGHRVSVLSSGGGLEPDFKDKKIHCYNFPIRTKSETHPKLFWALPGILSLVRKEKFDILHAHTRVTQVLAWMISKLAHIPFVSTAHGFYKPNWGRKAFPCWGDELIAVSALVAEELENVHHVENSRITIINNAVDQEELERSLAGKYPDFIRERHGIPKKAVVVGSVSRLVEDKGHAYLIKAIRKIRQNSVDVFLMIVGDGREKKNLEDRIWRYGLSACIKVIPGSRDVAGFLCIMDIFVHPATFREGFGLSIAEAMIARKPVIVTDIPAVNSIIQNRVNGLVVPPKDPKAIAEAIEFLIKNPEESRAIAARGYEMASKLCRLDRMTEETENMYRKVIERRSHNE